MAGNTYRPKYGKVYRTNTQFRFESFEDLLKNIPEEQIEVFYEIQANNIMILRYLPYIYKNDDEFLKNIFCDYFLDMECSGHVGYHIYNDAKGLKGYEALNGEYKEKLIKVPNGNFYFGIEEYDLKTVKEQVKKPLNSWFVKVNTKEHKFSDFSKEYQEAIPELINQLVECGKFNQYVRVRRVEIKEGL